MTTTLGDALRAAAARLGAAGLASPGFDAQALAQEAFALDRAALLARARDAAPADALARFEALVARRLEGEPVGRIRGFREFWGLTFRLAPDTLEPRPDTETVVEAALAALPDRPARALDLGTGSGCLLLAVLSERSEAFGVGVDRAEGAARAARDNAARLGFGGRAAFLAGDWAGALTGGFDLVLSNPPYIPTADMGGLERDVRAFDPPAALDGGADGLDAYRAIIADLDRLLAPGGVAVLELGIGQEADVTRIAASAGFVPAGAARKDLGGVPRALTLERRSDV
ncbi:release factor glutamine methyltransferase [Methylopila jiangsuensis]|uniref:Release factor glutamine methyltransferase n=1 Tax=Methylopila jiangsuensis TaxID=586230 RepID=A0A9W6N1G5_9HYPH|nr:peptide chain release factor N(5)-glutamine methyltransferase [Methylopila jiangsuensis]MDR6287181.1 release factor glutamine methyltransferase [Methylopila jiangsuensis]GLK74859.1 release factor glutamine methyltransferase [Methylopila jiangsuensis]